MPDQPPALIHATAVVDRSAHIGRNARIGPFCVIQANAEIGDDVELSSHVVVTGRTRIGARTRVHSFATLGQIPQDRKYRGEPSTLSIGNDCVIREGVTINLGTEAGGLETSVGDRCLLMAYAHVAHDCRLGDDVIVSNNVMLAGHVTIGKAASLGGGAGVHQHVRIGELAFVGGLTGLEGDLVPFGLAVGNRAHLVGLNLIGLRRAGMGRASIAALGRAFEHLFRDIGTLQDRIDAEKRRAPDDNAVSRLLAFLEGEARRPLCKPETP